MRPGLSLLAAALLATGLASPASAATLTGSPNNAINPIQFFLFSPISIEFTDLDSDGLFSFDELVSINSVFLSGVSSTALLSVPVIPGFTDGSGGDWTFRTDQNDTRSFAANTWVYSFPAPPPTAVPLPGALGLALSGLALLGLLGRRRRSA